MKIDKITGQWLGRPLNVELMLEGDEEKRTVLRDVNAIYILVPNLATASEVMVSLLRGEPETNGTHAAKTAIAKADKKFRKEQPARVFARKKAAQAKSRGRRQRLPAVLPENAMARVWEMYQKEDWTGKHVEQEVIRRTMINYPPEQVGQVGRDLNMNSTQASGVRSRYLTKWGIYDMLSVKAPEKVVRVGAERRTTHSGRPKTGKLDDDQYQQLVDIVNSAERSRIHELTGLEQEVLKRQYPKDGKVAKPLKIIAIELQAELWKVTAARKSGLKKLKLWRTIKRKIGR